MGFVYDSWNNESIFNFQSTLKDLNKKKKYKGSSKVGRGHIRQLTGKKLTRKSRSILQSLGYKVIR